MQHGLKKNRKKKLFNKNKIKNKIIKTKKSKNKKLKNKNPNNQTNSKKRMIKPLMKIIVLAKIKLRNQVPLKKWKNQQIKQKIKTKMIIMNITIVNKIVNWQSQLKKFEKNWKKVNN